MSRARKCLSAETGENAASGSGIGCQLKKLRLKSLRFLDTAAPHYAKSRAFDLTHLFPGSSVVERRTVNPLVAGSSPARGATS